MYVTRISRYIQRSVLSSISRNRRRSWNVLPVDTGVRLCMLMYASVIKNLVIKNEGADFFLETLALITLRRSVTHQKIGIPNYAAVKT